MPLRKGFQNIFIKPVSPSLPGNSDRIELFHVLNTCWVIRNCTHSPRHLHLFFFFLKCQQPLFNTERKWRQWDGYHTANTKPPNSGGWDFQTLSHPSEFPWPTMYLFRVLMVLKVLKGLMLRITGISSSPGQSPVGHKILSSLNKKFICFLKEGHKSLIPELPEPGKLPFRT